MVLILCALALTANSRLLWICQAVVKLPTGMHPRVHYKTVRWSGTGSWEMVVKQPSSYGIVRSFRSCPAVVQQPARSALARLLQTARRLWFGLLRAARSYQNPFWAGRRQSHAAGSRTADYCDSRA